MKKLLLIALCFAGTMTAKAQIADGSVAPDFTVTDVNGNTHNLASYLAQGKTVVMDISATWCSPCWSFHHSGTFEELYYTYGQGGSGEIVVLFVEGDANTPPECLFGISDENLTWGNWVEGSSFPMINDSSLYGLFDLNYFPTFFRICPDGIVNEIEQPDNGIQGMSVEFFKNNVAMGCEEISGLQRNAKSVIRDIKVCGQSMVAPEITLYNYGITPLNTATVEIRLGDVVLATKQYTGDIIPLGAADITFDAFEASAGTELEVIVTSINGGNPENAVTATTAFDIEETGTSNNNILVKVHTDLYPGEISWAIKDSNGDVAASGGPYEPGPDGNGMGGPDANTSKEHYVNLPDGMDCYTVELYDAYGDGWGTGEAHHGFEVISAGVEIFGLDVKNFGTLLTYPYAFKSNGILNNPEFEENDFTLYPNPTTGILYVKVTEPANVTIYDLTGKIVYTGRELHNEGIIDVSELQGGIYIAKIITPKAEKIIKVAIH